MLLKWGDLDLWLGMLLNREKAVGIPAEPPYFKNAFHDWISIVKKTCNLLWFKIDKDYAKTVKDIYTCGLYIPPCNSPYFK